MLKLSIKLWINSMPNSDIFCNNTRYSDETTKRERERERESTISYFEIYVLSHTE